MDNFLKTLVELDFFEMSNEELNTYIEENKESIIEALTVDGEQLGEAIFKDMNETGFRYFLDELKLRGDRKSSQTLLFEIENYNKEAVICAGIGVDYNRYILIKDYFVEELKKVDKLDEIEEQLIQTCCISFARKNNNSYKEGIEFIINGSLKSKD